MLFFFLPASSLLLSCFSGREACHFPGASVMIKAKHRIFHFAIIFFPLLCLFNYVLFQTGWGWTAHNSRPFMLFLLSPKGVINTFSNSQVEPFLPQKFQKIKNKCNIPHFFSPPPFNKRLGKSCIVAVTVEACHGN